MKEIIPVAKLVPDPENIRRQVGNVDDLAASLGELGLLEDLVVAPAGDGTYIVVCGHRRLAAAKKAGLAELSCDVRDFTDRQRVEAMLVENLQRESLAPLEEARAYKRLVDDGSSQRQIQRLLGKGSQSRVSRRLALLDLPDELQDEVDAERITLADAEELLQLKATPERMVAVWNRYAKDTWRHLDREVEVERAAIEGEAIRAAAIAELEQAGLRVVAPSEAELSRSIGKGAGMVPLTLARHKKLTCHAAMVDHRGHVAHICTDPSSHPEFKGNARVPAPTTSTGGGLSDEEKLRRAASRERNKLLRAAAEKRGVHLRRLVATAEPAGPITALVARQWLGVTSLEAGRKHLLQVAAELLDVPPATKLWGGEEYADPLRTYGDADSLNAGRLAIALGLAEGEHRIRADWGWGDRVVVRFYEHLESTGYKPAPVERDSLKKKGR